MSIRSALATLIPSSPRIVTFICGALAALVTSLPLFVTCSFWVMCFNDLPGFGDKFRRLVTAGPLWFYRWFAKPRIMMSIFHRVRLRRFKKPEDVFEPGCAPVSLLVDLEGTLTEFSPPLDSVKEAIKVFDRVASQSGLHLSHVHYVTNANLSALLADCPPDLSGRIHVSAHKPCFVPVKGFQQPGTVVMGDQYLTDGLLAWRYGLEFALVESAVRRPAWPRLQFLIGRVLSPVFFRKMANAEPVHGKAQKPAPE